MIARHSAATGNVTRRWGIRSAILLIAGVAFIVGLVVLSAPSASAGTCDINGTAVTTVASQAECDALVALYTSTDGPNWDNNTGWNTPTDPCGWYGVTCDAGVTELLFGRNPMTGPIPAEIGGLTNLAVLQLSYNGLSSVPSEIGGLTSLEWLSLVGNQLSSLPSEIGGLDSLANLSLSANELSGDITAPMSGLQDTLVTLALSDGSGGNSCLTTTDSVVTQLEGMASSGVSRHWGANRYETAVAVSEAVFPTGAGFVFIVTGVNFPDAVAAGPVAGMLNAPILLVTGTSVPSSTASELERLGL